MQAQPVCVNLASSHGAWKNHNKGWWVFVLLFEVKSSTASALRKHCFFSIATYVLCLSGSSAWKSNGKSKVRKPHHPGQTQQYSIALAVMTMEKEQNAVRE